MKQVDHSNLHPVAYSPAKPVSTPPIYNADL